VNTDTAIGVPHDHFPSTQVSLLEATAAGLSSEAMDRAIALYWHPVYRFIRRKFGKNDADAKDLTQGFFAAALQRDFFARFDPEKASFRTYIRIAVNRFVANQYAAANRQKRGGGIQFETLGEQGVATESPEQIFEREWLRQLFSLALDDLRGHCNQCGKQLQFRVFQDYDLADAERPSYAELAARHGIPETSVTNYLAWARRMLRGFVTERLRGTTASARELQLEMRRVWI
jgi:RNA polymerase sigma factor (sigma-70 family)